MQIIELDLQDNTVIKCPFCGQSLYDEEGLHECPHLLFHASDYGPDFVREDFPYKFGEESGDDVVEDDDQMPFSFHIQEVEMPYAFCFALVNHASPGMCGAGFTGFIGLCQYPQENR